MQSLSHGGDAPASHASLDVLAATLPGDLAPYARVLFRSLFTRDPDVVRHANVPESALEYVRLCVKHRVADLIDGRLTHICDLPALTAHVHALIGSACLLEVLGVGPALEDLISERCRCGKCYVDPSSGERYLDEECNISPLIAKCRCGDCAQVTRQYLSKIKEMTAYDYSYDAPRYGIRRERRAAGVRGFGGGKVIAESDLKALVREAAAQADLLSAVERANRGARPLSVPAAPTPAGLDLAPAQLTPRTAAWVDVIASAPVAARPGAPTEKIPEMALNTTTGVAPRVVSIAEQGGEVRIDEKTVPYDNGKGGEKRVKVTSQAGQWLLAVRDGREQPELSKSVRDKLNAALEVVQLRVVDRHDGPHAGPVLVDRSTNRVVVVRSAVTVARGAAGSPASEAAKVAS